MNAWDLDKTYDAQKWSKVCITCYMEIKLEMTAEHEYDLSIK